MQLPWLPCERIVNATTLTCCVWSMSCALCGAGCNGSLIGGSQMCRAVDAVLLSTRRGDAGRWKAATNRLGRGLANAAQMWKTGRCTSPAHQLGSDLARATDEQRCAYSANWLCSGLANAWATRSSCAMLRVSAPSLGIAALISHL
jgi:hypothetical protein